MPTHKWTFKSRFRANAYSWKATALATKRLKEAVSEIKKVAKTEPIVAADGAVSLMERIWPSLQGIDGSSGALGVAVNRTLDALIPFVIEAPADQKIRRKWLDRLYEAVCDDGVEYLSPVEERWGELCDFDELTNEWADRLLPVIQESWGSSKRGAWVKGASICLSCLVVAERYEELETLLKLQSFPFWSFDKFWAHALIQQDRVDEAIAYAETHRKGKQNYGEYDIVSFCEQTLIEDGRSDEAYAKYGLLASQATTNLTTYRRIAKKYPEQDPQEILLDLIASYGPKGKWFAAAKSAGILDVALDCASDHWADPATLIRAARDFGEKDSNFAAHVAVYAIKNLLAGGGYEPSTLDIVNAYRHLATASAKSGRTAWAQKEVDRLIAKGASSDRQEMLDLLVAERNRHS